MSTWTQREPWHYWSGDRAVELRRSFIECRSTETHRHFVLPYQRIDHHAIVALESDLREWDWITEQSKPVDAGERLRIFEEMWQALSVGEIVLEIANRRPEHKAIEPLSSLESLSDYLFHLANILRDCGADSAADEAFSTAIGFIPRNPITSEFLGHALKTLHNISATQSEQGDALGLPQLHEVITAIEQSFSQG